MVVTIKKSKPFDNLERYKNKITKDNKIATIKDLSNLLLYNLDLIYIL